jgi:hypothetical protein
MRQIYFISLTLSLLFPQIANACEPSLYSYSTITREHWTKIKKITINTSMTINREYVSKYDITNIIGFSGDCFSSADGRTEECIWIDGQDCKKKIQARFSNKKLSTINKSGF